jgi:inner membrane protein
VDPLTHGFLGAAIAQSTFTRTLGKKSLIIGAIAAMIPDMDMVASLFGPMAEFTYHRSITHSFWFPFVLAWALSSFLNKRDCAENRWRWFALIALVTGSHPFLDICTSYGTQFLAPFTNLRIKWNLISVLDIGFTLPLMVTVFTGLYLWRTSLKHVQIVGCIGLAFAFIYLGGCKHIQGHIESRVAKADTWTFFEVHPTPFQPFMRHAYATKSGYACVSFLHYKQSQPELWRCRAQDNSLIVQDFLKTPEAQTFLWYAGNNIYIEHDAENHVIRLHDIRYSLPSSPFSGVWGIESAYDPITKHFSTLTHFRGTRQIRWATLQQYLDVMLGHQPWT